MTDHSTMQGAQSVADSLRRWWASRGYDVAAWVVESVPRGGAAQIFGVRTDMVDGWPRRRLKGAAA